MHVTLMRTSVFANECCHSLKHKAADDYVCVCVFRGEKESIFSDTATCQPRCCDVQSSSRFLT
jgi:hypothetical protein